MKTWSHFTGHRPHFYWLLALVLLISFSVQAPANPSGHQQAGFLFLGAGPVVVNPLTNTGINVPPTAPPAAPAGAYVPSEQPGKSIADALQQGFTEAIRFVRTIILFFLLIYSVFMAVGMAFGQSEMSDVFSWVLGVIFFAGAGAIAQIYRVLFL